MLDTTEAIKEKMVMACKVLQKQGMVDGYGHLTARVSDDRILSTPHMPPGKVAMRDIIVIDAQGKKVEGLGEPNGETAMHTSIYKARPDVSCILHYHPDELVALSITTHGIQIVANCGAQFYRGAWNQLKVGSSNMDTLVALGSTTAFGYSAWALLSNFGGHLYFMEAAAIISIVSFGHWLEACVSEKAGGALKSLLNHKLVPSWPP